MQLVNIANFLVVHYCNGIIILRDLRTRARNRWIYYTAERYYFKMQEMEIKPVEGGGGKIPAAVICLLSAHAMNLQNLPSEDLTISQNNARSGNDAAQPHAR